MYGTFDSFSQSIFIINLTLLFLNFRPLLKNTNSLRNQVCGMIEAFSSGQRFLWKVSCECFVSGEPADTREKTNKDARAFHQQLAAWSSGTSRVWTEKISYQC